MTSIPDLTVNLADPSDVQAKLPLARKVAANLRADAEALIDQADGWDRLVHVLEGIAPNPRRNGARSPTKDAPAQGETAEPTVAAEPRGPSSVEVAVAILNQIDAPMTVAEVHKLAPKFSRKTIGWALWKAKQEGLAQALDGKGVYAPMSYQPVELRLDREGEP